MNATPTSRTSLAYAALRAALRQRPLLYPAIQRQHRDVNHHYFPPAPIVAFLDDLADAMSQRQLCRSHLSLIRLTSKRSDDSEAFGIDDWVFFTFATLIKRNEDPTI